MSADRQSTSESDAVIASVEAPGADSESASDPASAARVHDLGYQRYRGLRRPQSTRYRVIGRKVVTIAWRGWWRMKMWIIGASLTAFVISVLMYVSEGVSRFMRAGEKLPLADALLPMSFQFFEISAFALSMTVLASLVANDMRTGAFEVYFSRPVRTRDYVLGKLTGAMLVMGSVLLLGPVLLALVRIGLSDDFSGALDQLPRAAFVGFLATAVYAAVPLTFSAISSNKMHTVPAWGAFYFMTTVIVPVISRETQIPELQALDIPRSIHTLAYAVFDVVPIFSSERPAASVAVLGLCGYVLLAVAVLFWRVSASSRRGVGGGA